MRAGPEQELQSEAGYIDARPHTVRSTKPSCDARPDHTFGSNFPVHQKSAERPVIPQQPTN